MGDNNSGACITCSVFRPDAEPRIPNYPPVCDGDRALMDRHLVEIANLIADLRNGEDPIIDTRQHERFGTAYFEGNQRHTFSRGHFPSDPLATLGGVAPINSKSKQPSVSGSREKQIPISADTHDLKAPARVPNPSTQGKDWPEDQIGRLSAATTLDQWVRDWRDLLFPDQHLPAATVDELVLWLRNRLPDACDHHPAIDEFAAEMKALRGSLRSAAGEVEPQPEPCVGVPCKRCDLLMLFRQPDGDIQCLNPDCQAVQRGDEYQEWVKTLAAAHRLKRRIAENA